MTKATITATRTTAPGHPRTWKTTVPGVGWGIRSTHAEALALAELLLWLAARPRWPLSQRTPDRYDFTQPSHRGPCDPRCRHCLAEPPHYRHERWCISAGTDAINHGTAWPLPQRTPGAELARHVHKYDLGAAACGCAKPSPPRPAPEGGWPDADRRTPTDQCQPCLTHTDNPPQADRHVHTSDSLCPTCKLPERPLILSDTEPWPSRSTAPPPTPQPANAGPPSSEAEAPPATPPSASGETGPYLREVLAAAGTWATTPPDSTSEDQSTYGAIDTRAP